MYGKHEVVIGGAPPFYDVQRVEERGHGRTRRLDSGNEPGCGVFKFLSHAPKAGGLRMNVGEDAKNSPALQGARAKGIDVQASVVVAPGGRTASDLGRTEAGKSGLQMIAVPGTESPQ